MSEGNQIGDFYADIAEDMTFIAEYSQMASRYAAFEQREFVLGNTRLIYARIKRVVGHLKTIEEIRANEEGKPDGR
jgi:hypothetical protein